MKENQILRWAIGLLLAGIFIAAAFNANDSVTSTKLNNLNDANITASAGIAPEKIDDHSTSNAEQDETSDPYVGDAQTKATDLSLEIKQLRFQLAQIIQGNSNAAASQKWYNDPGNYLALPASGTQGDVWFYDRGADVKRLAAGTDGQFLRAQGANSDLAWGSALSMPASTTQGDIVYVNVGNTLARLAVGSLGQLLKCGGANSNPEWTNGVSTLADATTITPIVNTFSPNVHINTQAAGTLTINAPSGTASNFDRFLLRMESTNTQSFIWNSVYRGSTDIALPVSAKDIYFGFIYNSNDSKWDLIALTKGF